jgi:hypothetical protein
MVRSLEVARNHGHDRLIQPGRQLVGLHNHNGTALGGA